MTRTGIATVDATRARIFVLDEDATSGSPGEHLVEITDLIDPARRHTAHELYADTGPGSSRAGGLHFGFADRRRRALAKLDEEFARDIADELVRVAADRRVARLVVCASPRMLGLLRPRLAERTHDVAVDFFARDLVSLDAQDLHDHLRDAGMLAAPSPSPTQGAHRGP